MYSNAKLKKILGFEKQKIKFIEVHNDLYFSNHYRTRNNGHIPVNNYSFWSNVLDILTHLYWEDISRSITLLCYLL